MAFYSALHSKSFVQSETIHNKIKLSVKSSENACHIVLSLYFPFHFISSFLLSCNAQNGLHTVKICYNYLACNSKNMSIFLHILLIYECILFLKKELWWITTVVLNFHNALKASGKQLKLHEKYKMQCFLMPSMLSVSRQHC